MLRCGFLISGRALRLTTAPSVLRAGFASRTSRAGPILGNYKALVPPEALRDAKRFEEALREELETLAQARDMDLHSIYRDEGMLAEAAAAVTARAHAGDTVGLDVTPPTAGDMAADLGRAAVTKGAGVADTPGAMPVDPADAASASKSSNKSGSKAAGGGEEPFARGL